MQIRILVLLALLLGSSLGFKFGKLSKILDSSQYHFLPANSSLSFMLSIADIIKSDYDQARVFSQMQLRYTSMYYNNSMFSFDFMVFPTSNSSTASQYECYRMSLELRQFSSDCGIQNVVPCMGGNQDVSYCVNYCLGSSQTCVCQNCYSNGSILQLQLLNGERIGDNNQTQTIMVLDNSPFLGIESPNSTALIVDYVISVDVNQAYKLLLYITIAVFLALALGMVVFCIVLHGRLTTVNKEIMLLSGAKIK